MNRTLIFVLAAMLFQAAVVASCTKSQNYPEPQTVQIYARDSSKTISLLKWQNLKITLGNPGDGGYNFDTPQFDTSVLKFMTHTRTLPAAGAPTGDFGTDTWEYSAVKTGSTGLTITATRPFDAANPVVVFKGKIAVN